VRDLGVSMAAACTKDEEHGDLLLHTS
jgi:hypothetical protein